MKAQSNEAINYSKLQWNFVVFLCGDHTVKSKKQMVCHTVVRVVTCVTLGKHCTYVPPHRLNSCAVVWRDGTTRFFAFSPTWRWTTVQLGLACAAQISVWVARGGRAGRAGLSYGAAGCPIGLLAWLMNSSLIYISIYLYDSYILSIC
jgi:hypothetical protein